VVARQAVDAVVNAGVTVTVAAGNSPPPLPDGTLLPAYDSCTQTFGFISSAIVVGATNSNDQRAFFSNYGSCNDIYAPGQDILSAWHTADDATLTIRGTSMACPMVAGAAALLLEQDPSQSPAKVKQELKEDWAQLVEAYLQRSQNLRRVVCLIDAAVGLKREDMRAWDTVQGAGRRLMVVLTKVDRCHADDLHRNVAEILAALQPLDRDLVWPYVHAVSAEHDLGLRELRASLSVESALGLQEARPGRGYQPSAPLRRARRGGQA